ncbi:DNA-3-methyladenine glycosylase [Aureimonas sp. ME7]|uniref:DNA-3-methyladenine glycosylase n=1 Tax=Aureimonas sp. ME7 TaxID=2744252 RepID=UPI0015F399A9|nr:DNA-3-methyladenine glycosylase [Aureimonas sp. ME7]
MRPASSNLFELGAPELARRLIGAELLFGKVGGRIVETEAYQADDAASHSFKGETPRNRSMFGPVGRAYVYCSYGIHWCLNIVCDGQAPGSAVLLRALEPTEGIEAMGERRGTSDIHRLCSGPGRLTQALGIGIEQDGMPIDEAPFELRLPERVVETLAAPRVGITKAVDVPWRFYAANSRFVSGSRVVRSRLVDEPSSPL